MLVDASARLVAPPVGLHRRCSRPPNNHRRHTPTGGATCIGLGVAQIA